jgi:uncharacterized protein with FMN-binding domain
MRRAPIVLSATALGVAGVLAFHSHRPTSALLVQPPATSTPSTPSTPSTANNPSTPTTPGTPTTTTPAGTATRSATGAVTSYAYGQLSVTVTERGTKITDVEMASLNETDARSVEIDDQAIPQLRQEVLSVQSAHIDGISGATFTSQAYVQSLQSALDQLGRA